MRYFVKTILCLVLVFGVTGCSGTIPLQPYAPQNAVKVQGSVDVGSFVYIPYQSGLVKRPNQLQNTAIGSFYLTNNIADYVKSGTEMELKKSGLILNAQSPCSLSANILEFKADDLGYSCHWTYSIEYIIKDKASGTVRFSKVYTPPMLKTNKFLTPEGISITVRDVILSGYELFINDKEAIQWLQEKETL